ncbi:hypothetical protein Kfla_3533 [Kribbella flavida DSM 17836]|uniref:Uncharacterized protein n=1 Tax=Kribbella flavida (strain DSM 17836 / JCM 10339 / NBRC 14399) TaxID=479435 RepID=D2PM11_KRIFD|nr:hypothetical protein [Kribbella flavida]ADB32591.1 hypothetical protein Kfla_3533 [Kribbella flavida DSM 17836]
MPIARISVWFDEGPEAVGERRVQVGAEAGADAEVPAVDDELAEAEADEGVVGDVADRVVQQLTLVGVLEGVELVGAGGVDGCQWIVAEQWAVRPAWWF